MLILGSRLINLPIMGLQTGTSLALTKAPIIDPSSLKIIAYEVDGPLLSDRPSFIRIADVRELSGMGMIVDSADEFIGIEDVIVVKKIYNLNFKLIGLNVLDELKNKLGKVSDYSIDSGSFTIQQLNVYPGLLRSLSQTELLINRSQIIEINDRAIIVRSTAKRAEATNHSPIPFINPFRSATPQTQTGTTNVQKN